MAQSKESVQVHKQGRRRRIVLLAGGVLAAVFLAVSLFFPDITGSQSGKSPALHPQPSPPAGPWSPGTERRITLPAPRGESEGFPTNFPHSPQGAVAAMAAMLKAAWTLDELQARRASAVYASPQIRDMAVEGGASTARELRKQLGLPLAGDAPQGAFVNVATLATRWQEVSSDKVKVAMMVQVDSGLSPQVTPRSKLLTISGIWLWDPAVRGGDWVFTKGSANEVVPQLAEPGTPEFVAAGWIAIQQEGHP